MRARWLFGAAALALLVALSGALSGWWTKPQRTQDRPERPAAAPAAGVAAPGSPPAEDRQAHSDTETSSARAAAPRLARLVVDRRSQLPVGPLQEFIHERRAAAERGDAQAAWQLGLALKECHRIQSRPDALEAAIQQMYQTRRYQGVSIENTDLMARELRRRFERCSGIEAEDRDDYYLWMERAADAGSLEALESMVFQLPPGNICRQRELEMCDDSQQANTFALRRQQARWLQRARQRGSANALWQLGAAYLNGEMLAVDSIQAYAHLRAFQLVSHAFGTEDRVALLVSQLRDSLRPVEVAQGDLLAWELVENPRCCVLYR